MARKPKRTAEQTLEQLTRRGWAPAYWSHHPAEIREAIRAFGWRPKVKECFANCQRFITHAAMARPDLAARLEYHEGYVVTILAIEHAWLTLDGEVVDLTLGPGAAQEYGRSNTYTVGQILKSNARTGMYGPVDPRALNECSPYFQAFQKLMDRESDPET